VYVVTTVNEIRKIIKQKRQEGKTVGLVPTMGYFHQGHLSLMEQAREHTDFVVVSLFVNPTQFGPGEDFETYPRDLEKDKKMAEGEKVDVIFAPSAEEMYPKEFSTSVIVERLTEGLCGRRRPGHFQGVTTVVSKLFNSVMPDKAFFGQKDGQQFLVIKRMVEDLNIPVEMVAVSTVREKDGLAMSSRNSYLDAEQRKAAVILYRSLCRASESIKDGERDADNIIAEIQQVLKSEPLAKVEYVEIRDRVSLSEMREIKGKIIIALAVRIGQTRLIDNFMLDV